MARKFDFLQTGIFQHYRGSYYQVIGLTTHSETNEKLVIYILYIESTMILPGLRLRATPLSIWNELVRWPDGSIDNRFRYVGEEILCVNHG